MRKYKLAGSYLVYRGYDRKPLYNLTFNVLNLIGQEPEPIWWDRVRRTKKLKKILGKRR